MKSARFVVFQDKKKQWRWRLKAGNGRVIAQGESHTRWRDAIRAIEVVKKNIRGLTTIDMVSAGGSDKKTAEQVRREILQQREKWVIRSS